MATDKVAGSITPVVESISADDIIVLREGQAKMNALDVEKATINNFVINLFVKKYKLQAGDNLDVDTGTITRKSNEQTSEPEAKSPTTTVEEHPPQEI